MIDRMSTRAVYYVNVFSPAAISVVVPIRNLQFLTISAVRLVSLRTVALIITLPIHGQVAHSASSGRPCSWSRG